MKLPATTPWASRSMVTAMSACEALASVGARALPGRSRRLAWRETANKLRAVGTFQKGVHPGRARRSRHRPVPPGGDAEARFLRLWRTEGEGFWQAWAAGTGPGGELPVVLLRGSPRGDLVPLHAGLGVALAIRTLDRPADDAGLSATLDRFLDAARYGGAPGWSGAVVEALGLTTRLRHPGRVAAVDRHLASREPELRRYLWHGVGRALYFLPTHAAPFGQPAGRSLAKALAEPPEPAFRDQAVAGLAQAVALVNLRRPEVVESFVLHHDERLPPSDAFEYGMASAQVVWAWAGGELPVRTFADHRPRRGGEEVWDRRVLRPCRRLAGALAADLERSGRPGELFLHRPLEEPASRGRTEEAMLR